jgi:hypothetical protein
MAHGSRIDYITGLVDERQVGHRPIAPQAVRLGAAADPASLFC